MSATTRKYPPQDKNYPIKLDKMTWTADIGSLSHSLPGSFYPGRSTDLQEQTHTPRESLTFLPAGPQPDCYRRTDKMVSTSIASRSDQGIHFTAEKLPESSKAAGSTVSVISCTIHKQLVSWEDMLHNSPESLVCYQRNRQIHPHVKCRLFPLSSTDGNKSPYDRRCQLRCFSRYGVWAYCSRRLLVLTPRYITAISCQMTTEPADLATWWD